MKVGAILEAGPRLAIPAVILRCQEHNLVFSRNLVFSHNPDFSRGNRSIQESGSLIIARRPIYRDRGQQFFDNSRGQIYPSQPQGTVYYEPTTSYSSGDLPSAPVMSSEYIVIRCPASSGSGSISYLLSSQGRNYRFTLFSGQEQRFKVGTGWTIGFNDGVEEKRYRLEGGMAYTLKNDANTRWKIIGKSTGL